MRPAILSAILFPLFAAVSVADAPRIAAGFSAESALPGELVEFRAKIESETFAEFELTLQETPLLHLVSEEAGPVNYAGGRFSQTHIWVFQAVASGNVRFENVEAKVRQTDGMHVVPVPTATLAIAAFPETDLSDNPEPLPVEKGARTAPLRWLPFAVALPVAMAILVWLIRRRAWR